MTDFPMIINGLPVNAANHFDVKNPATGETVGRAPNASRDHLDQAVAAAEAAFASWSQQPDAVRAQACLDIADKLGEQAEDLAQLLTREQGKPLNGLGSRFELGGARAWAAHTASLSLPVKVLQDNEQGRVELHRKPIGVVGSITPWN